jgi:hypothetical protein
MRWIITLLFLLFGFCVEAQKEITYTINTAVTCKGTMLATQIMKKDTCYDEFNKIILKRSTIIFQLKKYEIAKSENFGRNIMLETYCENVLSIIILKLYDGGTVTISTPVGSDPYPKEFKVESYVIMSITKDE